MQPGVLRTASGVELAAYSDGRGTLKVWSSTTGDRTVASGLLSVGQACARAAALRCGRAVCAGDDSPASQLQGVLRFESTSDGARLVRRPSRRTRRASPTCESAVVRPDGTPMFSAGRDVRRRRLPGLERRGLAHRFRRVLRLRGVARSRHGELRADRVLVERQRVPEPVRLRGPRRDGRAGRPRPCLRPAADRTAGRRRSPRRRRSRQHVHGLVRAATRPRRASL